MAALPPDPYGKDWFSARFWRKVLAYLRSLRIRSDGSILVTQTPGGQVLKANLPQEADFRITAGANPYDGTEQRAIDPPTLWEPLPGGRAVSAVGDGLFERGGNTTVPPGVVVHARRDPQSGRWIFDRGNCP